jgi:hypothetical protein
LAGGGFSAADEKKAGFSRGSDDAVEAIAEQTSAGKVENDLACLPATGYDSTERKSDLTTETPRH